jgi:predicted nucleotidyltransferase
VATVFEGVLLDFDAVAVELGVEYVLIGAGARFLAVEKMKKDGRTIPEPRVTLDWDIGAQVENKKALEKIHQALCRKKFTETNAWQKFRHKESGLLLDLIPFGGIASGGELVIQDSDKLVTTLGFEEALRHCLQVEVSGRSIPVVDDRGFCILKLVAWHDRKNKRDLKDLWHVIENYDSPENIDRMFEVYSGFAAEGLSQDELIPRLLGRDLASIMNEDTRKLVETVLGKLAEPECMDLRVLTRPEQELSLPASRFNQVLQGIKDIVNG